MSAGLVIIFILLFIYLVFVCALASGFISTRVFRGPFVKDLPITIIICARNEENTIAACIGSILQQDYETNKMQLILVDDASVDATLQKTQSALEGKNVNFKIITNASHLGKKQSITRAMTYAEHDLIITRDADTFTHSQFWLASVVGFRSKTNADLIIGPIALVDKGGLLWALQAIENNVLAVFAGGSAFFKTAFLCSGANLCFTKKLFEKTGGYQSHLHIASGDDIFFLEEAKKITGTKVEYLKAKDAIVKTYTTSGLRALLHQKIRWASKFGPNKNILNRVVAVLAFLINLVWICCVVRLFFYSEEKEHYFFFVLLKLIIDILLLFLASGFIRNKGLMWYVLPAAIVYPLYILMITLTSPFINPRWKS